MKYVIGGLVLSAIMLACYFHGRSVNRLPNAVDTINMPADHARLFDIGNKARVTNGDVHLLVETAYDPSLDSTVRVVAVANLGHVLTHSQLSDYGVEIATECLDELVTSDHHRLRQAALATLRNP